jgi:hypothetical protein
MSILKRFLTEDLPALFRKAKADRTRARVAEPRGEVEDGRLMSRPKAWRRPEPGMKVVILNWKEGDNDPFTVVTESMRQHLHACGKNAEVIEITEVDWPARLAELLPAGIEFVFTWQGFCSNAEFGDERESLWDRLKIPLICIHGDHPSQMPSNHQLESRYCFHLYTNAEFARYSNRHFRRMRGAGVIDIPQVHREPRLERRAGDHFVFAKNINDPLDTEEMWRQKLNKPEFDAYMMAAETLKALITREPYIELHDVLDDLIAQHGLAWLDPASNAEAYHQYHRQLDHYLRSHKSVAIVTSLREFPIHIYGRGWDRIARTAPASHVFEPGKNMADSQELYYTRFGIIDVSPSKGLHDRTRRAMVNGCGFLSSANLEGTFADIARFDRLFFSFRTGELSEKCAAVLRDPEGHHDLAHRFGVLYHDRFHFRDFVNRIDQLAKLAKQY